MPNKLRNAIAFRLLFVVLLFCLAITLISAGVGLYFDYWKQISSLERDLRELEKAQQIILAETLWLMDTEHLQVHMQGFLNIDHIIYAKIEYKKQLIASAGTPQTEQVVQRQFPILYTYNDKPQYIGTLFLTASLKEVYGSLRGDMASRLLSQGFQVFLIALFIFVVVQVFVTRHLVTMAAYFREEAPWESDKPLVLAGYTGVDAKKDEIGQVAVAINSMATKMRNAFCSLEIELKKRKEAEESLQLFRKLIDQSNDAIFVIDPETGRFLDVNDKVCSILGYTRGELLAKGMVDVAAVIPDDFSWKAYVAEVKNRGYMILEDRHKRKDGSSFPVEVSVKYMAVEKGDYLLAVVRDITERKRAEEVLRRLNEDLEQRVKMRTAELNEKNNELGRLNKLFVGRELRMIELKERILELEEQREGLKK